MSYSEGNETGKKLAGISPVCDYCGKEESIDETESGRAICLKCNVRRENFVLEGYSPKERIEFAECESGANTITERED